MPQITHINHIGIAVQDIDTSLPFWRDALGLELSYIQDTPQEQSRIAFLPVAGVEIELIQPTAPGTGLARFIEKRGPGLHHLCLEVDDLDLMLEQLKEKGVQLINQTPQTGSDGRRYAFIHPKSTGGVLLELYEL
jgi:methylmalonyl-CoA/ethylmalonyl-CoA epimerase